MSLKFAIPLAVAAACLPFANYGHAATYTESGDAGDMLSTAQQVLGTTGTPLTSISGALTLTNAISDGDMYEIYIPNPSAFAASNTAFVSGSNNFDSQLFIFSATGLGLAANDDSPSGGSQSSIPAGSFSGAAGNYYILIDGSGRYAASSSGVIFPNYTDGTTDPTNVYGPTGPGGGNALSTYSGNSNEAGNYTIALTGAQFVTSAVPEPTTYAYVIAGVAGLALVSRARRSATR